MNKTFIARYIILILFVSPMTIFAQLDDQALSFSYRFGMGKVPFRTLDPDSDMVPQAFTGGEKWCRSSEFDMTWHFIPNLGATLQLGGTACRLDTIAFENKMLEQYTDNFANTFIPRDYRFVDLSVGPSGFLAIDEFYMQAGALIGTTFQQRMEYDVYLYAFTGKPSHTYQHISRGPLGWQAEGNMRIGYLSDGDVRIGFFAGGSYRYIVNRLKVDQTHIDAIARNVTTSQDRFTMTMQAWQVQIGMQILIGG
jgi:hypothetical protein